VAFATALGGALYYAGVDGLIVFPFVTVALAGLAWLVALGTDALGNHVGPGLTGVLQSTLGNLPELFVVIFALKAGEVVVAQTSILDARLLRVAQPAGQPWTGSLACMRSR
jgi:Ca2+:H+ antiporter